MKNHQFEIYTSYARTAIYLALLTIDVKDKEIMLPTFTCATTLPDAIVQAGGVPIFIDVHKTNLQMIEAEIEKNINSKTKAIITHHYYGSYCSNVKKINVLCKKYNLFHIEDYAHGLGLMKEVVGDIAVFSFSKNLNNPGGGKVVFTNKILFEKALKIQKNNKNIFHSFIINVETFEYLKQLIIDRSCNYNRLKYSFSLQNYILKVIAKLIKLLGLYPQNYFYKIKPGDVGKKYVLFDTRMTRKQKEYIEKKLVNLEILLNERKQIAIKLNKILPSFLPIKDNIFTNYVIYSDDLENIQKILNSLKIKTRRVWPFFQKYWPEQKTDTIKELSKKLLLIDIDCIDKYKIKKLMVILHGN